MSPRFLKTTIVFCLIFSLFHGGSSNTIRAATNGNVTLQPGVKGHIDEILWKHKGNKMVEWDRADPIEYLTFKGRTKLDIKTGDVTIVKLTKDDNGDYEAELLIGTDLKIIKHTVEVIDPVEGPKVTCQISNTTVATLHCEAVGELLSYNWSGLGLQAQMKSQTGPQITKEKDQNLVYTCMVNNPVSNSSVAYHSNECFASDAGSLPLIIGVVCAAVIVVAAAVTGFCYHYYKKSTGQNDAGNEKGFKKKRRMEKKPLLCLKGEGDADEKEQTSDSSEYRSSKSIIHWSQEEETKNVYSSVVPQTLDDKKDNPAKPLEIPEGTHDQSSNSDEGADYVEIITDGLGVPQTLDDKKDNQATPLEVHEGSNDQSSNSDEGAGPDHVEIITDGLGVPQTLDDKKNSQAKPLEVPEGTNDQSSNSGEGAGPDHVKMITDSSGVPQTLEVPEGSNDQSSNSDKGAGPGNVKMKTDMFERKAVGGPNNSNSS